MSNTNIDFLILFIFYQVWNTGPTLLCTNNLALKGGSNLGKDYTSFCLLSAHLLIHTHTHTSWSPGPSEPGQFPSHKHCCFSQNEEKRKIFLEPMSNTLGKWKIVYNIHVFFKCNERYHISLCKWEICLICLICKVRLHQNNTT